MIGKIKVAIAFSLLAMLGVVASVSYEHFFWKAQPISYAIDERHSIHLEPSEAHRLTQIHQDNPDFVILDVRTPSEFSEGHLVNAINVDFYADTFEKTIRQFDRDKVYLIYCRRGVRSDRTLHLMQELGFQRVHNLRGGTARWNREGFRMVLM